ncbi:MAG: L,D-transpeptidase [Polyangiaceae bacterium]|nr:L,D-transpeptidase [Polyangiaceae bacterium]
MRSRFRRPRLCALAAVTVASSAGAAGPPWVTAGDQALPEDARSVQILRSDEPVWLRPQPGASRRGSVADGTRLPLYGAVRGPGCRGRWLSVGPVAWVCEDVVALSAEPPVPARRADALPTDPLPHRYHFAGPQGALGYSSLLNAEAVPPDAELEPGFAVAVTASAIRGGGDPFGLTTKGLWIPLRDLIPARRFDFEGATLNGSLDVGWVFTQSAEVYRSPGGKRHDGVAHSQFTPLTVLEVVERARRRWFRVGPEHWVSDRDVRAPTVAPIPSELVARERWIDVDVDNQILVSYEGTRPVFATLVSTGRGKGKSELATPKGTHRIWVKLVSTDMDNLENAEASRYYAIQDVPWVMFFKRGYGLHGTFWHRSFGKVRSHGCVNLTPKDAARVFAWTNPRLPAGWTAALPNDYEPGTLIQVR